MSGIDWALVAEVFADALDLPAGRRAALLEERCAGRPEVRAEVERLLAAEAAALPDFLHGLDPGLLGAAAAAAAGPPARVGPWRLVREIGEGGMGQVYLAERADGQFEQQVAVKLLKRGMDSEAVLSRFLRERRILAALDHPNIARLLDGGVAEDGRPYFVMEYVAGQAITRYADEQRLPVEARVRLFRTVCLAVEYAHRNLVVHRDLKPSNILVTADGRPKLLDFGIAKLLASTGGDAATQTEAGVRLLTPAYAAPEQFHGGAITTSTDVYGLGAVLYELLSGRRPFDHEGGAAPDAPRARDLEPPALSAAVSRAAAEAVAAARATDPPRLRRQLAGDLDTIVATALRATPERRYVSVGALREDLRRHQEGLPVRARPDTPAYRLSRFVRRHRVAVLAAGTIAALLVAFGVTAAVQARAIARERDRARHEAAAAEQVADFLVGVFEVADPMRTGLGDSVRARDLLDRGAERVGLELAGQPALQARMLGVMGRAYDNLSRSDLAEPLVARALQIQRAAPDAAGAPAVAATLQQLARLRMRRGDYDGGEDALREAMAIQDAAGAPAAARWGLLVDLVDVFHGQGNLDSARATVARAMAVFDSIPASGFTDNRESLRQMTAILGYADEPEAADTILARLVAAEAAASGPRSEAVARAYADWAQTRQTRGDLRTADSLLRLALDIYLALPAPSIAQGRVLTNLGDVGLALGRPQAADSFSRAAMAFYREQLGEDHRLLAMARASHAELLQRAGRPAEAIPYFRLAIAAYRRGPGEMAQLPVTEWRLAEALRKTGRLAEAAGVFDTALRGHEATFPPGYLLTANVRRDYARLLLDLERHREAVPMLRQALAVFEQRWGGEDARVGEVRELLARAEAAR